MTRKQFIHIPTTSILVFLMTLLVGFTMVGLVSKSATIEDAKIVAVRSYTSVGSYPTFISHTYNLVEIELPNGFRTTLSGVPGNVGETISVVVAKNLLGGYNVYPH